MHPEIFEVILSALSVLADRRGEWYSYKTFEWRPVVSWLCCDLSKFQCFATFVDVYVEYMRSILKYIHFWFGVEPHRNCPIIYYWYGWIFKYRKRIDKKWPVKRCRLIINKQILRQRLVYRKWWDWKN